jgi:hypothetical protein
MVTKPVEGLADLDKALGELPKATAANVLRRVGLKALEPFIVAVKELAPVDTNSDDTPERAPGQYRDSWHTGTKLNKNQARTARREGKSFAETYAGTNDPLGVPLEYGTRPRTTRSGKGTGAIRAQPHGRPAWDATHDMVLKAVQTELGGEITKAAQRLAKKAARGK